MSFTISIETREWHSHLMQTVEDFNQAGATVVPVIKGNGYGLGQDNLCAIADKLGAGTIAVGTIYEALRAMQLFHGEVIVLEPFNHRDEFTQQTWAQIDATEYRGRLIRVVDNAEALDYLAESTETIDVLLEGRTAMNRFGMDANTLREAWTKHADAFASGRLRLRGLSCHLPLESDETDLDNIVALQALVTGSGDVARDVQSIWVSHVDGYQVEELAERIPGININVRSGTGLWLGERDCLHPFGAVLSVVDIKKGERAGYFQRKAWDDGWLVTISGGTAHGVGLMAPTVTSSGMMKFGVVAKASEQAMGRLRSPFWYHGDKLDFFESPHQHVSMVFIPSNGIKPIIGDMLPVDIRYSITHADVVDGVDEILRRWDVYTDQRRDK